MSGASWWFKTLLALGLMETRQVFDSASPVGSESDFFVAKDMVVRDGLRINRNMVILGQASGDFVVERSETPFITSITVMEGAQVSNATLCADHVVISEAVKNVSIVAKTVEIKDQGSICGDSEVIYTVGLHKGERSNISGRFEFVDSLEPPPVQLKARRTRLFTASSNWSD